MNELQEHKVINETTSFVFENLKNNRRFLHAHPELAFNEWNTMSFLIDKLKETHGKFSFISQEVAISLAKLTDTPLSEHSFLNEKAFLPGFKLTFNLDPNKTKIKYHIAIRADLDALPIIEDQSIKHFPFINNFCSVNNAMHACAHDGHLAIALQSALFVNDNIKLFEKSKLSAISFIFQPAEEGCRGAQAIIKAGFLDDIDEIFCYHLGLGLKSGFIAPTPHGFLSSIKFHLNIYGKKSHAGRPQEGVNALQVMSAIVQKALKLLVVKEGIYINFSNLHCPGACNIIPDFCSTDGEIRVRDEKNLDPLYRNVTNIIESESKNLTGSNFELIKKGYGIDIKQDIKLCDLVRKTALTLHLNIQDDFSFNASEDASLLIRQVQKQGGYGCYFIIGSDIKAQHHHSCFDFDENSLLYGYRLITDLILEKALERC